MIGRDRVLVFGLNGVMISIKVIYVHIGHDRSVVYSHQQWLVVSAKLRFCLFLGRRRVGRDFVFSSGVCNTENKMSNLSNYMSKSRKVKMNYSRCHVY